MAPALTSDAKIPCPTPQHLHTELETLTWALEPEEKEDTWEKFEKAIIRFAAVTRGGGYKHVEMYVEGVGRKGVGTKLAKCMLSDRGRLSGVSTDLLQTFAPRLSFNFKPLVNLYLESLVELLGRPNKVFLKRAEKCLSTIISHCQIPTIIPELKRGLSDNAATCRRGCAIGIERAVREWPMEVWGEKYVVQLEEGLRKMATDKDPETRHTGKRVWAKYMEIWPERVDDFSAPLTPTIRRYLDIPSANGAGPSKPKAPSRPAAPPLRPISAASTTSSLGSAATAASRPQHHRVQALTSRAMRTAPVQYHQPTNTEAGPSRRQSPRKASERAPEAVESQPEKEPDYQALSHSASGPSRPFDAPAPGILARHGRSVSHNILPSTSTSSLIDGAGIKHNPLSKPSRPALLNSLSTISLPVDPSEAPPARRFAPPARILRVIPAEDEDGSSDMMGDKPYTGSSENAVFRGPVRPPIGRGRTQSGLGQAQRRVVTAPASISEENTYRTPGMGRRAYSHRRMVEDDSQNAEAEEHQVAHPVESVRPPARPESAFTSPAPLQAAHVDSPLLPVLIRSSSHDDLATANQQVSQRSEDVIDMKEDVYPASPRPEQPVQDTTEHEEVVQVAAGIELPLSPAKNNLDLEKDDHEAIDKEVEQVVADHAENDAVVQSLEHHQQAQTSQHEPASGVLPGTEPETTASKVELTPIPSPVKPSSSAASSPASPLKAPSSASTSRSSPTKASTAAPEPPAPPAPPRERITRKPPIPSQATTAVSRTKTTAVTTSAAPARKPPVPLAPGRAARVGTAPIVRKPFKPTSNVAAAAAASATAGSVMSRMPAASASTSAASSAKPDPGVSAPAPAIVSKPSISTSTIAAPAITANSKPPLPPTSKTTSRVVSNPTTRPAIKPPIPPAAAARPAQPRIVSGTRKPIVAAQVPLPPPTKKEKIRLKAPLPSFRPTRTVSASTSAKTIAGNTTLSSSTTSSLGGRARVKPENIKLPDSPAHAEKVKPAQTAQAAQVALPSSPHEVPIPRTPEVAASTPTRTARSSIASKRSSGGRPSPLKMVARARAGSAASSAPQSPIAVARPRPASPLLTTAESEATILPSAPLFAVPESLATSTNGQRMTKDQQEDQDREQIPRAGLNDLGLPASDLFASVSARTQFSKASTVPALRPQYNDEASDDEEGQELEGITFKSRPIPSLQASAQTQAARAEDDIENAVAVSPHSQTQAPIPIAFAPRSDVSTPSKSAAALLAKLDGMAKLDGLSLVGAMTPGERERKVLSVKDANTNTPGWFDADVSA